MNLPKVYSANDYESDIYELWLKSGAFEPSGAGEPFSIVLPPPNATGRLHIGHSAMIAIEDTIVRYKRMNGGDVLWIPGTDHAAIATNAIMEKKLASEGKSKHDVGREAFLELLADFVENSQDNIREQMKAMGASLDWSQERYTMEPAMNRIVSEVFIKMFSDELIYRGKRIVNWDGNLQTTVSDDELDHKEEKTTFYTLKYGPFEIGTARPETKFGDKYVVVHPDDKRYKEYSHGQKIEVDWINGKIEATVIKDDAIDMSFGTGAMTITPWHSAIDFEIAERHKLDMEQIIDLDGKLMPVAGEFTGMHISDARGKIVEKMRDKGLLVKEDPEYMHNVSISDRGKAVIEPQVMEQWFVDVNKKAISWKGRRRSLKEVMQAVVRDGDIEILPKRFEKTYFGWIDNLRDWCISRQIWWGHRVPAWYRKDENGHEVEVGYEQPEGEGWRQDPDTLDTWFSSALWTWSTMIPPEIALDEKNTLNDMFKKSETYKKYHPTTLMETGYDILFFWVARMILMTTYVTGEVPFKTVYLHGLVRTKDGSKMSKSTPESAIDPLDVIPKYGTDAVRLALLVGQAPGNDMRMYEEKIASYRNFCNKLWNIARFIEGMVGEVDKREKVEPSTPADYWILDRLNHTIDAVEKQMEKYELGKAYEEIYHFIWDDFADWYIEASKAGPNNSVLMYVLEVSLKIVHPFAPYVSETIWDTLKWEDSLLISSLWPEKIKVNREKSGDFQKLIEAIKEVRNIQSLLGLSNNTLYYSQESEFLERNSNLLKTLGRLRGVSQVKSGKGLHLTSLDEECWLDIEQQKVDQYLEKIQKRLDEQQKIVENYKARLENKSYIKNAPKNLVEETRMQLQEAEESYTKIKTESEGIRNSR